ncbi:MAG TPA: glycogen debranching protein [Clostridiaceae bacterium]|nr:glycogen debranching protein [Clostridiaceae bacterium]
MNFVYGKNHFTDIRRAQENCYLLTNRKGGYSSLSIAGSSSRNEHVLFMAAVKAPNQWVQYIGNIEEIIRTARGEVSLGAQEYVGYTKNQEGFRHLNAFTFEHFPRWSYLAHGVALEKTVIMKYEENLVLVDYVLVNHNDHEIEVSLKPWMRFTPKGIMPRKGQRVAVSNQKICSGGYEIYYSTDGSLTMEDELFKDDLYFEDDAKDARDSVGSVFSDHRYDYKLKAGEERKAYVIYSLSPIEETPDEIRRNESLRKERLTKASNMESEIGKALVLAADAFVVDRESTGGRTIIAGYPFFGDWGRDTMIAVMGCCIAAGRKEDTENIFRSFMKYMKKGIMPNMFPEGEEKPMYNTVDASLLFIYAVYEYYQEFKDLAFVSEAMPAMEEIIEWYKRGTDFHIRMDEDYLITAGSGLEQVTWMDVRINDVLPTPRHGKPVEINAYWYNDLMIMAYFHDLLDGDGRQYKNLAEKVRVSFLDKFWNDKEDCLKDLVSGSETDNQVRCNQIWAVSVPFGMLDREKEKRVVEKVYRALYTPYGLRSLSPEDIEYHPFYGGSLWDRDTAYHQGTVWGFPLGGYYLAYLKVHDHSMDARMKVIDQIGQIEGTLREGCIGQIAEIFDGDHPYVSKGCFAQAWSVGEILRALKKAEEKSV